MADAAAVPPDLLEFFRELRRLADDVVARLELAAAGDPKPIDVVVGDVVHVHGASVVTLTPATLTATAQVLVPTVITATRVEEASVWLGAMAALTAAARPAWLTADAMAVFESLLQLAERLLQIGS